MRTQPMHNDIKTCKNAITNEYFSTIYIAYWIKSTVYEGLVYAPVEYKKGILLFCWSRWYSWLIVNRLGDKPMLTRFTDAYMRH